MIYVFSLLESP